MPESIVESMRNTLRLESEALMEIRRSLDSAAVVEAVEKIAACKGKIILAGCGTSGAAAKKIAHTLCCIDCPALFLSPSDALHGGLGVVQQEDIVILLSKGGQTQEINGFLVPSRQKGAYVIGVTENTGSILAKECNLLLKVQIVREPDDFNMLATSSTLAVVALFDAVAIAITKMRGYSRERFAMIHPGGAVGERLTGKILFEK